MNFNLKNVKWRKDEFGDYWIADFFKSDEKVGIIGNYYDLNENGKRLSKEEVILPYIERRK